MKFRELLKKIGHRSPRKRSDDSVDKAFTASLYEKAASSYTPSQQGRPRH